MAIRPRVLFLCSENSCRTQMAEALLRDIVGDELDIHSAGAHAGELDPDAVLAMQEVGIDISGAQTKIVDPYLREKFHYVITLCDRDQERTCPVFPGAIWRQTWPVKSIHGHQAEGVSRQVAVRLVRDKIREHVHDFVREHHHTEKGKQRSTWN